MNTHTTRARAVQEEDARRRLLAKLDTVLRLIQGDTVVTAETLIRGHLRRLADLAAVPTGEAAPAREARVGAEPGAGQLTG